MVSFPGPKLTRKSAFFGLPSWKFWVYIAENTNECVVSGFLSSVITGKRRESELSCQLSTLLKENYCTLDVHMWGRPAPDIWTMVTTKTSIVVTCVLMTMFVSAGKSYLHIFILFYAYFTGVNKMVRSYQCLWKLYFMIKDALLFKIWNILNHYDQEGYIIFDLLLAL